MSHVMSYKFARMGHVLFNLHIFFSCMHRPFTNQKVWMFLFALGDNAHCHKAAFYRNSDVDLNP